MRRHQLRCRPDSASCSGTREASLGCSPIGGPDGSSRSVCTKARHGCASIFIAAGVNMKALSSYLGHASITITMDRYGHLMPGNEPEAVALVDAYLSEQ